MMDNIVTKFQINPRSDGVWARTKVRFAICMRIQYKFRIFGTGNLISGP